MVAVVCGLPIFDLSPSPSLKLFFKKSGIYLEKKNELM